MTNSAAYRYLLQNRTHLIFGANTDVGKTIVTTGLVQASLRRAAAAVTVTGTATSSSKLVKYVKPLQCGGSDQSFVDHHIKRNLNPLPKNVTYQSHILHQWESYASPHLASRVENHFVSNDEVLSSLSQVFLTQNNHNDPGNGDHITQFIESAGGVLSPGPASSTHNKWSTQADLYAPLSPYLPTCLVGDGNLGGISATLSSLESLWIRGYHIDAIVLLEQSNSSDDSIDMDAHTSTTNENSTEKDHIITLDAAAALTNTQAIQEYISDAALSVAHSQQQQKHRNLQNLETSKDILKPIPFHPQTDVFCVTKPLPPMPLPLDSWFQDSNVLSVFDKMEQRLQDKWNQRCNPE